MITIDLNKAKAIAHERRRIARDQEFAPMEAIISKQIPGTDTVDAEAQRQLIRDKYDAMQEAIDAATTVEAVKEALEK